MVSDDESRQKGNKFPQYLAALSVCMGSVAAGTVLGWTSNIGEQLKAGELNDIKIDTDDQGWIGSFATLGALLMCFPIGIICDVIGRKMAMLLLVIPFTVGWLIIIFSTNVGMIFAGRFITGMAGGAFCVSAPMYTSEIAEKEIRGALGSYFQLLLTVGILFAYVVAYITTPKTYTIICAVIPLVFGVVFFLQPETPVYLLKKGKDEEAKASLRRLRGSHYDVDREIKEIKTSLEEAERDKISFLESFKKRSTKKASLIAFGLMFFQQFSGVNAVIFYTGDIFEAAGDAIPKEVGTIIVGVMQVGATFISSLIIDKLGRKILLLGSDLLMAVGGIMLGVYFSLKNRELVDEDTITSLGFLPILSLSIFIIVFSLGYGPIPWLISSEVFPSEVKTIASSAAGTFNWLLAFIITKTYLSMVDGIGGDGAFYIYSGISILGTIFVLLVVPETKGKTLDQIQRELNGEKITDSGKEGVENRGFSN